MCEWIKTLVKNLILRIPHLTQPNLTTSRIYALPPLPARRPNDDALTHPAAATDDAAPLPARRPNDDALTHPNAADERRRPPPPTAAIRDTSAAIASAAIVLG